ncbi:hypothetical protein GCM10009801_71930 [Streptomyces albiaxialis]|uniref:Uncharacterized protein n=1 Tax=Streptomyces albiaxialis TaxID=329523 RepID=A0ABN2WX01_9ACTN
MSISPNASSQGPFILTNPHAVTLQTEEVTGHEWRPFSEAAAPTIRAKLALLPPTALLGEGG